MFVFRWWRPHHHHADLGVRLAHTARRARPGCALDVLGPLAQSITAGLSAPTRAWLSSPIGQRDGGVLHSVRRAGLGLAVLWTAGHALTIRTTATGMPFALTCGA